jgi:hypothetical protein
MGIYVHACTYTIERDIQQYYRARPHAHKVGTERQYTQAGTYMFMQTHECALMHAHTSEGHMGIHTSGKTFKYDWEHMGIHKSMDTLMPPYVYMSRDTLTHMHT